MGRIGPCHHDPRARSLHLYATGSRVTGHDASGPQCEISGYWHPYEVTRICPCRRHADKEQGFVTGRSLRGLAVAAYVFGYPLVSHLTRVCSQTTDPLVPFAAPVNFFGHAPALSGL